MKNNKIDFRKNVRIVLFKKNLIVIPVESHVASCLMTVLFVESLVYMIKIDTTLIGYLDSIAFNEVMNRRLNTISSSSQYCDIPAFIIFI